MHVWSVFAQVPEAHNVTQLSNFIRGCSRNYNRCDMSFELRIRNKVVNIFKDDQTHRGKILARSRFANNVGAFGRRRMRIILMILGNFPEANTVIHVDNEMMRY
jgi:uncharacterized Fe-S cluster-containing protein